VTDLTACGNGCKDADAQGVLQPRMTEDGRTLCESCCDRLWKALDRLPDHYVRLYAAILPGSVERNPETKATKRVHAPAPLRIDPIDLYDERHYLIGGSLPTENVRGVVGVLQKWANLIRVQQGGTTNPNPTLATEVARLVGAFDFLVRQPYAPNAYKAVMTAQREVKDAIGMYRQHPVGRCPVIVTDDEESAGELCGGPLFPTVAGVKCVRCGSLWSPDRLAHLGAMIGEGA
jgi:hypothetical protein